MRARGPQLLRHAAAATATRDPLQLRAPHAQPALARRRRDVVVDGRVDHAAAARRAAVARQALLAGEPVVVRQLLARRDVAAREDDDVVAARAVGVRDRDRAAVAARRARVVEQVRDGAGERRVDARLLVEAEDVRACFDRVVWFVVCCAGVCVLLV